MSVVSNEKSLQAGAMSRFYVCQWPDFYAVMNRCDREVYQWIEQIPLDSRPWYLNDELQRIANATYQQQQQQWLACESGRYAVQTQPKPGLRLAVASRLVGGGIKRDDSAASGIATRLSVSFAPGSSTPQPTSCPPVPFHFLHKVDKMGLNYYPQNTVVEFTGQPSTYYDGIGPWEGGKVVFIVSLDDWTLLNLQYLFHVQARVRSDKVFDHWVSFVPITNPAPPASLVARSEPFDLGSLKVQTSVPYDWHAPKGQRGQGWHMFVEYTHVESGQAIVVEDWLETNVGWYPVGLGGYSFDQIFYRPVTENIAFTDGIDGTWNHRVCVYDFYRLPTEVNVLYNGVQVESGVSSITPLMTTDYVPGAAGIASVDESITLYTVGATKASFRILGVEPVPGFGVRFTIKVVNELHFAACIVTPFLSGIGDRTRLQDKAEHFSMPMVWVVRNLGAHSESGPISIFVPMQIIGPGDWPLLSLHWALVTSRAFAAPLNQFADGVYGIQRDSNNTIAGPYPDLENWPPPGYKISNNPEEYANLLAGYLENGDKVWYSSQYLPSFTNRLLLTMPVRIAPGNEVPYVRDPRSGGTYPTYSDQAPFLGFFEWTAEYRVSTHPEVWEPRSGSSVIGLSTETAIARYGRNMTLSVANGRPMWSPYYEKWITVFETWPGGNVDELETYLIDTYLRPQFEDNPDWRNFEYTTLKPPYLTTNVMWWFESNAISDDPDHIQVLPLVKEASSADTVDVMLMGYW